MALVKIRVLKFTSIKLWAGPWVAAVVERCEVATIDSWDRMASGLARLRSVAASLDCAVLAAGGPDANDPDGSALLSFAFPHVDIEDVVLMVAPSGILLYCPPAVWAGALQPALEDATDADSQALLNITAYVPEPGLSEHGELDFKLQAVQTMVDLCATETSMLLAGFAPLSEAASRWPLLRAMMVESVPFPTAGPAKEAAAAAAAAQLRVAMRSLDAAACEHDGWAGRGAAAVASGWSALQVRLGRAGDAYDRGELSELGLAEIMLRAAAVSAGVEAAAMEPSAVSGVWAGVRSARAGLEPSRRRQLRLSGPSTTPALHAVVRIEDPAGSGVAAARSLCLSNGAVPHHWQHRVFSDGEVFDPIVEDEVPSVERADETIRLLALYGALARAVADAAAELATCAATHAMVSEEGASDAGGGELRSMEQRLLHRPLEECGLLPAGFDLAKHAKLSVRRLLRPRHSRGAAGGAVLALTSAAPASEAAPPESAPASWWLHVVSARLDGVPSLRWSPDAEGSLLYEDTYCVHATGGATCLTEALPLLVCWPSEGAEESEARQVRGALESNTLCKNLHVPIERLRAGEHHVLQVLASPVEAETVVLTTSSWLPLLHAELRLFTGGISLDTPQHGPHVLPFRIHLDAVATYRLHDPQSAGLLMLRQKPDSHGYGPLALLPETPGEGPIADADAPPLRTLSLAIVVPPRSTLQHNLEHVIWPIWRRLFDDCGVPCDELSAPPAEFAHGLGALRSFRAPS